ncbi:MAG: primosomal protein N' [Oscillospiraceae bacterium]|nr:primosomal protein N' [Oscillospiraceae bacterium]
MIARVAVSVANYSLDKPYDYLVPEELQNRLHPGSRVFIPFSNGNQVKEGIVLSLADHTERVNCKAILSLVDSEPILSAQQLQLALFMREHYYCTVYEAARAMLPAGLWLNKAGSRRAKDKTVEMLRLKTDFETALTLAEEKRRRRAFTQAEVIELLSSFEVLPLKDVLHFVGTSRAVVQKLIASEVIELYETEIYRRPDFGEIVPQELPVLNEEQQLVFRGINTELHLSEYRTGLLSGVTGSGKTRVYAHLISECLQMGRSVILLVPEIALTPQMMSLFKAWFGDEVALLHSGLSVGERYDEWKRIRRGEARIVLGTRSAVFAPVSSLGMIIMDEEQEESYRSDSNPRYHAKEIADCRCRQERALFLLGSATPDLKSRYYAEQNIYSFYRLQSRYNLKPLPAVQIIDLKEELRDGNSGTISMPLRDAIFSRIERGEQSILFLNKRGTNKLVSCPSCGFVYKCPHCSVAMTWHARPSRLICHYCGYTKALDRACPQCEAELQFSNPGTQKVSEELNDLFPETGILRVDADSVSPLGSHRLLFERFQNERIPIMVGTQMVAKGLSFDNVTLVGVLSADQSLYGNDFRAGERTFALLTQVIGRCGRGDKMGEAYIQTFSPDNEIIHLAAKQDYESFYHKEIEMRRIQKAPPFYDWLSFSASGRDESLVIRALHESRDALLQMVTPEDAVSLIGPLPFPVAKISDHYRYRLQLCCRVDKRIRRILSSLLSHFIQSYGNKGIYFYIENDF